MTAVDFRQFCSHKVLNVLGNDNLHSVILFDTLGHLVHEIQGHGILAVDKYMGPVDNDYNFSEAPYLKL